jgi:hypothetical protein
MTTDEAQNRRRDLSKKAWTEAFARLTAEIGAEWQLGLELSTPEIDRAEKAANEATESYASTGAKGAREALAKWEALMRAAIARAKAKRGCHVCGIEKVVEVVDDAGNRSCGKCRAGSV